ncbi:MAG: hypothetical protein ACRC2T_16615 [Thermoguttaceae bacterium]
MMKMTDWAEMVREIRKQDEEKNGNLAPKERAQKTNELCRETLKSWGVSGKFQAEPLRSEPIQSKR